MQHSCLSIFNSVPYRKVRNRKCKQSSRRVGPCFQAMPWYKDVSVLLGEIQKKKKQIKEGDCECHPSLNLHSFTNIGWSIRLLEKTRKQLFLWVIHLCLLVQFVLLLQEKLGTGNSTLGVRSKWLLIGKKRFPRYWIRLYAFEVTIPSKNVFKPERNAIAVNSVLDLF